MRHRTVWEAVKAYFRDYRLNNAIESVETSVKARCVLEGSLQEQTRLLEFYKEKAASIDPWHDHHGFADARQKYLDTKENRELIKEKLNAQRLREDARKEHLADILSRRLHPENLVPAIES